MYIIWNDLYQNERRLDLPIGNTKKVMDWQKDVKL